MDYFQLEHGEKVQIEGELYEFDRWLGAGSANWSPSDELQFIQVRGLRAVQWSFAAFDRLYQDGKVKFGTEKLHPADRLVDDGEDGRSDHEIPEKEKRA